VLLTLTLETEAFEQPDLFLLHLDLALARGFRRPEQALALGEQVGAGPHAVHAACGITVTVHLIDGGGIVT
jgi:hypothetical protein